MRRIIMTGIISLASCSNEVRRAQPIEGMTVSTNFGEAAATTSPPEFDIGIITGVELRPFEYEHVLWYLMRKDWKITQVERGALDTVDPGTLPIGESTWIVAVNNQHISIPMPSTAMDQLPLTPEAVHLVSLAPLTVELGFIDWEPASAVATVVYDNNQGFRGVPVARQQVELPIFSLMVPRSPRFHLSIYLDTGVAIQIGLFRNLPHAMRIDVPRIRYVAGDVRWEDTDDPCVGASVMVYREQPSGDYADIIGVDVTDRAGAFSIAVPAHDAVLRVFHEDATFDLLTLELQSFSTIPQHASALLRDIPSAYSSIEVRRQRAAPR